MDKIIYQTSTDFLIVLNIPKPPNNSRLIQYFPPQIITEPYQSRSKHAKHMYRHSKLYNTKNPIKFKLLSISFRMNIHFINPMTLSICIFLCTKYACITHSSTKIWLILRVMHITLLFSEFSVGFETVSTSVK